MTTDARAAGQTAVLRDDVSSSGAQAAGADSTSCGSFGSKLRAISGQQSVRPISPMEIAWLVTVTGLAVASVVMARHQGWVPAGDDAVVVTRSGDVVSRTPPLLGMPTSLIMDSGEWTYHPGPLLFVWLAPFVAVLGRVMGGALGATALNLTAIVASWWFGRSMFGPRTGMVAGTIGVLVVTSFVPMYLPLNSSLAACGTFAVFVTAWATLMRTPRAAFALIFFASMTAQSHVAYAMVTLSVAVPVLGWDLVRRWRGSEAAGRACSVRAIAPVAGVTVALWIGPLLDRGRNLVALVAQPGSGFSSRGPQQALSTLVSTLGQLPVEVSQSGIFDWSPNAKPVDPLFSGEFAFAAVLVAAVGVALLVWSSARGDRSVRAGSVVLALALIGAFVGTTLLPLREPLDVQLFWARCVSLFAFLLYAVALRPFLPPPNVRGLGFARSRLFRGVVGALTIVGVATIASRELDPDWMMAPPGRQLAQDMTKIVANSSFARSDKEMALIALGGVATPAAASAEQSTFGVAAARIERGKPTVLDAFWYWGSQRSLGDRYDLRTSVLISPRPAPGDLPDGWTEIAHVAAAAPAPPDLPERLAAAVVASGAPIELAPTAADMLPTVVDGLLPGDCEVASDWVEDPSKFAEDAPAALVELYRAGLVAEPALPADLQSELWVDPFEGLWAYRVEGTVARDLARNDRIVLNRLGCGT